MIGDCPVCGRTIPEEHNDDKYCSRRCKDIEKRIGTPRKNTGKK